MQGFKRQAMQPTMTGLLQGNQSDVIARTTCSLRCIWLPMRSGHFGWTKRAPTMRPCIEKTTGHRADVATLQRH